MSERTIVGRTRQLQALRDLLDGLTDGPRVALLEGAEGSGRGLLVTHLVEEDDLLALRWRFTERDDGVAALLRVHAGLAVALVQDRAAARRGLDVLRGEDEDRTERLRSWLATFTGQIASARPGDDGKLELRLPRDNPYWGLLHAVQELAARQPLVIDLAGANAVTSPAFWVWLHELWHAVRRRRLPVLWIVSPARSAYGEQASDETPTPSGLLLNLLGDDVDETIPLPPLDDEQVQRVLDLTYRPHALPPELAPALRAMSDGQPAHLADLLALMESEEVVVWGDPDGYALTRPAERLSLGSLIPMPDVEIPAEDATGAEDTRDGQRLAEAILRAAAVEGDLFTSGLVAEVLDLPHDTVDDLLDEMEDLVEEVRHLEAAGSWQYRFRRPTFHRYFAATGSDRRTRNLPSKMARALVDTYLPASFGYLPVAARLFNRAGQSRQARNLLALAMGSDRLDLSRDAIEILQAVGTEGVPDALARMVHAEPAERAVNGASPEVARQMLDHLARWAEARDDGALAAYEQLLRSRLATRQRDLEVALEHAQRALDGFREAGERVRCAETLNQMAMLALHRRDAAAARRYLDQSASESNIPPVKAHALFIRGLLQVGERKLAAAAESFGQATTTARTAGNALLALEAQLKQGEMLIVQGRASAGLKPLRTALAAARAMRAPSLERSAAMLLAQAEGAAGNASEAYDLARDALALARHQGLTAAVPGDLYHCGLFAAAAGRRDEARDHFRQALEAAPEEDATLRKEIQFHLGQMAMAAGDLDAADAALEQALQLARQVGDGARVARTLRAQGLVAERREDPASARTLYQAALDAMTAPALQKERADLVEHLKNL